MFYLYQLLFIVTAAFTGIMIYEMVTKRRHLLVKPSVWCLVFVHLQIQWPAMFFAVDAYERLFHPYDFYFLSQVLPLFIVLVTRFTFNRSSRQIYDALQGFDFVENEMFWKRMVIICVLISTPILLFYFLNVPWRKTGLYQSFAGGDVYLAVVAREESLKLASTGVRYSYVFFNKTLAVIVAMYCVYKVKVLFGYRRFTAAVPVLIILLGVVFLSSLSGARSHGVYVLLGSFMPVIMTTKFKLKPAKWVLSILVVLLIPVVLQLRKFNMGLSLDNILIGYETIVMHRTFSVPVITGVNWIEYVQRHGFWGFKGVSFLQSFTSETPVVVSNYLMNYFNENVSVESGLMNTSVFFSYYSYFGYISYILVPVLILLLDWVLKIVVNLKLVLKLVAVCLCAVCCINLVNTEYHTIFLSYGYATGLLFLVMLNKIMKKSL